MAAEYTAGNSWRLTVRPPRLGGNARPGVFAPRSPYRPNALESDLTDHRARALLLKYGYVPENPKGCVVHLIHRLRSEEEFPHEIGLFLSYPPEDVRGFIENRAQNFKRAGLWKVYGDEARAEALFRKFKKCTQIYCERWQSGSNMDELAVAV